MTPELNYLLKPLGLYVLMFGVLMAYSIVDPLKYRTIIIWGAFVLLMRSIQRLAMTVELHQLFGIPVKLNLLHCIYLFVIALMMLLLVPKSHKSPC